MSIITADDLHRIFKNLDKQNRGLITIHELHSLLQQIGIHATSDDLQSFVGRTSIDYVDFLFFYEAMVKARMAEHNNPDDDSCYDHEEKDLLEAFKVFDLNGDGYISWDELEKVLSRLGLWEMESGRDCKDMIRVYDENLDGVLDFGEFKNMMASPTTSDSDV